MKQIQNDISNINQSFIKYDISNNGRVSEQTTKTDTFTVQIFNSDNYKNNEEYAKKNKLTIVDITPCLEKIKKFLNVTDTTSIPIEKVDWDPSLTTTTGKGLGDVTYNYYNPNTGEKLNSTEICSNVTQEVKIPINTSEVNMTLYGNYKSRNVNVYDGTSDFYHSRCMVYQNDGGFDVPLTQRAQEIFPNISLLCSSGCSFDHIDTDGYMVCACKPSNQSRADVQEGNLLLSGIDQSNLDIFICTNRAFNLVQ
jgi:flagellin-like hook-associated protein FlgL